MRTLIVLPLVLCTLLEYLAGLGVPCTGGGALAELRVSEWNNAGDGSCRFRRSGAKKKNALPPQDLSGSDASQACCAA